MVHASMFPPVSPLSLAHFHRNRSEIDVGFDEKLVLIISYLQTFGFDFFFFFFWSSHFTELQLHHGCSWSLLLSPVRRPSVKLLFLDNIKWINAKVRPKVPIHQIARHFFSKVYIFFYFFTMVFLMIYVESCGTSRLKAHDRFTSKSF